MKASHLLIAAVVLAGCGKKSSPPAAGTGSTATVATDAAPAPVVDAGAAKPAAITKEVRAEYKKRLSAGRKAAKAAKWPEAIAELEAALAAIPGDDRALSELSFAAMSAGDHDQARKAGRQAVLVATDPKIKAAALYNLGRVEETAAPAKAAALYKESLALRPNATVEKRLADLGSRLTFTPEPPPCAKPMPVAQLCPCLVKSVPLDGMDPSELGCELDDTPLDGFQVADVTTSEMGEHTMWLVAKSDAGWSVVAHLEDVYNPGAFGISEEWELESAKEERLGTRAIVRLVSQKTRNDSDMGIDEVESETTTGLVVCVRDNAGGPPACPINVTTAYTYLRDRLGMASDDDMTDVSDYRTSGLPIRHEMKLSVELGADGVAKIRAVKGRPENAALGDKRLW